MLARCAMGHIKCTFLYQYIPLRQEFLTVHIGTCLDNASVSITLGVWVNVHRHQCLKASTATCSCIGTIQLLNVLQSSGCAMASPWGFDRFFPRLNSICNVHWSFRFPISEVSHPFFCRIRSPSLSSSPSSLSSPSSSPPPPHPSVWNNSLYILDILVKKLLQMHLSPCGCFFTNLMVYVNQQNFLILMKSTLPIFF